MNRYDLAKVLEEIRRDEQGAGKGDMGQKILSQEEIRAMARKRRRKPAGGEAPQK